MRTVEYAKGFLPITVEKSEKGTGESWVIQGLASTPDRDFQGEKILPDAIDYSTYFVDNGWITYEHSQDMKDIIGEPLGIYSDDAGLHVKAKLFKNVDKAKEVWHLQNVLAKESEEGRSLGFSVEGPVLERDPMDKSIITKMQVKNITVTSHPANPHATWETVKKSLPDDVAIGYNVNPSKMEGNNALRAESLAGAIIMLSYTLGKQNCDTLMKNAQEEIAASGLESKASLATILQLSRGISREEAEKYATDYINKE